MLRPITLIVCMYVGNLTMGLGQSSALIKDINRVSEGSSVNHAGTVFNGALYFSANDGKQGEELWVTDGTTQGTEIFYDIFPGASNSNPHEFATLNNYILFVASDPTHGMELWRSNGTMAGTTLVKDIVDGTESPLIRSITPDGNRAFFKADVGDKSMLYITDGTEGGTLLLKEFDRNPTQQLPDKMVVMNHVVYFRADDGSDGYELWKSNGTVAGTVKVSDAAPASFQPEGFIAYKNNVFFSTTEDDMFYQSDGTTNGTKSFQDLLLKACSDLTIFKDVLYFTETFTDTDGDANDGSIVKLWKYNGTTASVVYEAKKLDILHASSKGLFITVAAGEDETHALYLSNGTSGGTVKIKDIKVDNALAKPVGATSLLSDLVFAVESDEQGTDLWISNGKAAGTFSIGDTNPDGYGMILPNVFFTIGDKVVYWADDQTTGYEPWITDGTEIGTYLLKDIAVENGGSFPNTFRLLNEQAIFVAYTGRYDQELWISDGSLSGTHILKDINESGGSGPSEFVLYKNELYFTASDGIHGYELWKTNGTEAGTTMVSDVLVGASGSFPSAPVVWKDHLYFWAANETAYGLWRSDGTADGTMFIAEDDGPFSGQVTATDDYIIYFNGQGVWRSDGTDAGTIKLKNMTDYSPTYWAVMDNVVFFVGKDANGSELWKTGGTVANTVRIRDIYAGAPSSDPQFLTYCNNRIYFVANNGTAGQELWKSDGSSAGTVLVEDIYPGADGSGTLWIKNLNNVIFFNASDGIHGNELWTSNGAAADTQLFKDFSEDENDSFEFPGSAGITGGKLFMNILTNENAIGVSDGTEAGTEVLPLEASLLQIPQADQILNFDKLYLFGGDTESMGEELWALDYRDSQVLTFTNPGNKVYRDPDFTLSATSNRGLPIVFDVLPKGIVHVEGATASVIKPGQVNIIAAQEGNSWVKPAKTDHSIVVDRATQTINFPPISDRVVSATTFTLTATASSGLPVSFTTPSAQLSVINNQADPLQAGRVTVVSVQPGNSYYKEAVPVEQSFCISPLQPAIVYDENEWPVLLTSNTAEGNQWYLNNVLVPTATEETFVPVESGTYSVKVSVDDCASAASDGVAIIVLGTEGDVSQSLKVYPNPTNGPLTIEVKASMKGEGFLYDAAGRKRASFIIEKNEASLDVSSLQTGIYFIQWKNANGKSAWKKVMKK